MSQHVRIVEIRGLEFQYSSRRYEHALRLSVPQLQIDEGDFIIIIGPNGSGKSTLCKLLAGVLKPSTPAQQFVLPKPPPVLVWQEHELFPLTVEQNLRIVSHESAWVEELMFKFSLAPRRTAYPWNLSGGEKEKVAIARALAVRQRNALIFDEPTQAIDPGFVDSVALAIKEVLEEGKAVVVVTHDNRLVSFLGKRNPKIYVLEPRHYAGERIAKTELVGPFDFRTLFEHPPTPYAAQFCGYQNLFHLTSLPLALGNLESFEFGNSHASRIVIIPEDAIDVSATWTAAKDEKEVSLASEEIRSGRRRVVKYRWAPQGIKPLEFYVNWDAPTPPPQKAYLSIIGARCIQLST